MNGIKLTHVTQSEGPTIKMHSQSSSLGKKDKSSHLKINNESSG